MMPSPHRKRALLWSPWAPFAPLFSKIPAILGNKRRKEIILFLGGFLLGALSSQIAFPKEKEKSIPYAPPSLSLFLYKEREIQRYFYDPLKSHFPRLEEVKKASIPKLSHNSPGIFRKEETKKIIGDALLGKYKPKKESTYQFNPMLSFSSVGLAVKMQF